MKKILLLLAICIGTSGFAQDGHAPQAIKYQAVIRDLAGNVVANNSNIRMKVSILQYSANGSAIYSETHNCESNGFGLVHFEIGRGQVASPNMFSGIDWGDGPYFVKMEVNIDNTGFTNMSIMELVSVPYALFAEKAGNAGVSYELSDYTVPVYDMTEQKLKDSKISQNRSNTDPEITINGSTNVLGDMGVTEDLEVAGNLGVIGSLNISGGKTLTINNYRFPATTGNPGDILALTETGDSLVWKEAVGGGDTNWLRGNADDQLRNRNTGSVIIGSANFIPSTTAKLHIDNGDFVVRSTPLSTSTTPPYRFDSPSSGSSAGIMWWGAKQAFRVGQNDRDADPEFWHAWEGSNIGEYTLGLGNNVIAKGFSTFGIGRNLYVDNGGDSDISFVIGANSKVEGLSLFGMGIENTIKGDVTMRNSIAIGIGNEINRAQFATIVGSGNTISYTSNDAPVYSRIFGDDNEISDVEKVSVLGADNDVQSVANSLILGLGNEVQNINSDNHMTIVLGSENKISNRNENITIGYLNTPQNDSSITIGMGNSPSARSIVIGHNNNDGKTWDAGSQARNNILIGQNNNFSGFGQNSIAIGQNIATLSPEVIKFATSNTINIGNNINPYHDGTSAEYSVNIGTTINTRSNGSINIGRNINASVDIDQQNFTVNIGNDINNNYESSIVLGRNNPALYPTYPGYQFYDDAIPALVVGINGNTLPTYHPLYIDYSGNTYLGYKGKTSSGIPNYADPLPVGDPNELKSGTLFANAGEFKKTVQVGYDYDATNGGNVAVLGDGVSTGFVFACAPLVNLSDQRFKSNIKPLESGLEDYLYQIRPYSYTFNADQTQKINWGFLAQEVQLYFPHLVHKMPGNEDVFGLNYTGFIPVLWKIAQDQQTKIDEQQMRIEELERQIEYILQKIEQTEE